MDHVPRQVCKKKEMDNKANQVNNNKYTLKKLDEFSGRFPTPAKANRYC